MISELVQDLWKMFKNQKNSLFKGDSSCNVWVCHRPIIILQVAQGSKEPQGRLQHLDSQGEGPAWGCSCPEQHNPMEKYNVSHKYNFKCFSSYIKKEKELILNSIFVFIPTDPK